MLRVGQTLYDTGRWKDCQVVFKRAPDLMEKQKDATPGLRGTTAKEVQEKIAAAYAKIACVGFTDQIKDLPPHEQVKRVRAKFEKVNGAGVRISKVEIVRGMKSIGKIGRLWNEPMAPDQFWKKYDAGEFNK